jgi:hypothetical protein
VTGTRIWRYLKAGLTLDEVSHRLQQEFDVHPEQAARSVHRLVDELVRQQLAQHAESR